VSIVTQAPAWFILLCILAGAIYAAALYFRDRFNRTYGWKLASLLGLLRFLCVTFLALFLLKPLVKTSERTVEKPVVVIAQDNSESIITGKDSAYYKTTYLQQLKDLAASLSAEYDVQFLSFGASVQEGIDSVNYSEQYTDYSSLLNELHTRYSGRNLGAIVLATDGIYNKGANPVYSYQKLNVPVFTIALGDTTVYRDILLSEVTVNRLAYLGNQFPVQIIVEGRKAAGAASNLTVTRNGNTLFSQNIVFNSDRDFQTIQLVLDAKEVGLQRYTVSLAAIDNELTVNNNRKDFFIDVLDGREKVLILAQAPHPDVAALREAIEVNDNYRVEAFLAKDFSGNVNEYNLILFHQLPSTGGVGQGAITNALEGGIPALFIWGSATDFNAFNALNTGISLRNFRSNSTDIGGTFAEDFALFTLSPATSGMMDLMPPLTVPFGETSMSPGASPLAYQRVGTIRTKKPLIAFNRNGDNAKTGVIAGEGIWRWRMTAFGQQGSHDAFNELVTKSVQYLAAREDKSLFRVEGPKNIEENQNILFSAEVYNQSFEAINNRDVAMEIRNEQGEVFNYTFSPASSGYRLDAGRLPVGQYTYVAKANSDQGVLQEKGEFSVSPLLAEVTQTIADHRLLYQFAKENNGERVFPSQTETLADLIRTRKEIVPVSYETKQLDDLISFQWLLAVLLGLLCLEWLLRKRAGTY
jgi:hypothetical protein